MIRIYEWTYPISPDDELSEEAEAELLLKGIRLRDVVGPGDFAGLLWLGELLGLGDPALDSLGVNGIFRGLPEGGSLEERTAPPPFPPPERSKRRIFIQIKMRCSINGSRNFYLSCKIWVMHYYC